MNLPLLMNECPKPVRDVRAMTVKIKEIITHGGPNHIFNECSNSFNFYFKRFSYLFLTLVYFFDPKFVGFCDHWAIPNAEILNLNFQF